MQIKLNFGLAAGKPGSLNKVQFIHSETAFSPFRNYFFPF